MKTTSNAKKVIIAVIVLLFIGIGAAIYMKSKEPVYVMPVQEQAVGQNSGVVIKGNEMFETLSPDAVPKDVVDAVKKYLPDAAIAEATCKTDIPDGDSEYRMKLTKNGKQIQAQIDVDPKKGTMDGEINERVAATEIPQQVVDAFKKNAPDLQIGEAEKRIEFDSDGTTITYRWDFKDKDMRVAISQDGNMVEIRQRLDLAALPQNIVDAMNKAVPGAQFDNKAERRIENGKTFYRIKAKSNGKKHDITISETGEVQIKTK
ncbi:MAG: PepSY-like domain-containing protein [Verrucomicrobiia bacterium]|jgi:hypothetical protein